MDVLAGILENEVSDAENDDEDEVPCENDDEITFGGHKLDTNEIITFAVSDRDINNTEVDATSSSSKLGIESRYFAVVVDNPEDITDGTSIAIAKDATEKILNAMKLASVIVLIGSRKEQCFIGYAHTVIGDVLSDSVRRDSLCKKALKVQWDKICCLPFRDTVKIRNAFNDDKPVSQYVTGQEIDAAAAEDVLYFIDDANTEVETIEGLRILLKGSRSRPSEEIAAITTSQYNLSASSSNSSESRKAEESHKENGNSNIHDSQGDREGESIRREDTGGGKRPRTDSVVSTGSGPGSENQNHKSGPLKRGNLSSNLPKLPRPKNMFDITSMSYEQYVDRHYAIKYEQWFVDANSINASPAPASTSGGPGMGPSGGGGMPIPMAMAIASNMGGGGGGGGGYFRGQGTGPGPGAFGAIGGSMMMPPPMGIGMGGMGMGGISIGSGGPINPLMMHDPGMFQGLNMHSDNGTHNGGGHMFNDRGRTGRGGGNGVGVGRGRIECGEAKSTSDVEPVAAVAPLSTSGLLLITACNDFENATSKTPLGLEEPHVIQLPHTVRQCFSSSSSFHSFILSGEGRLYAFGRNDRGQLGTGDIVTYSYPVELPSSGLFPAGSIIVKIATGRSHSLILLESGDVYGCGANTQGQLGLGDSKVAIRDALRFVKIPSLTAIRDISCGYDHSLVCDRSGRLLTFGHPQYGQLGHGTDGSFIKDGGKGAAMQFRNIFTPRQVEKFVVKDSHGKLVSEVPASEVNIRLVAAGKNHSVCVEEWENNGRNKVYSFGFGGYGRLGHNSGTDELCPREVTTFQTIVGGQQVTPENFPQKQINQIVAGSTYTMAISKSKHLYFWGKLSNSQRGEAVMYPKMEMNLYGWNARHCAGGSNSVFVAADASCMAWGVPVSGKFGFEGGARSSVSAKFVDSIAGLNTLDISCGYGHVCFVVNGDTPAGLAKIAAFPVLPAPALSKSVPASASIPAATGGKETKKRGKATAADSETGTIKKGKGK